jgi:predicted DNA-binding protein
MSSVRTQVYLDEETYQRLHRRRERLGLSLADQVREAVRLYLEMTGDDYLDDPIWRIAGQMDSRVGDLAANHDHYLYEKGK